MLKLFFGAKIGIQTIINWKSKSKGDGRKKVWRVISEAFRLMVPKVGPMASGTCAGLGGI